MHATIHFRQVLGLALAPAFLFVVGCAEQGFVEPESRAVTHEAQPLHAAGARGKATIDLSGSWEWSETTVIKARAWAVPLLFGIAPEGPITHIRCDSWGTLEISQTGSTFSGSATQSASCVTKGGKAVPAPFPPTLPLVDGEIIGRSFRFTFNAGFPCPYKGAIRVTGGEAVQLQGSGDCQIPNEQDLGREFVIHFVATRS